MAVCLKMIFPSGNLQTALDNFLKRVMIHDAAVGVPSPWSIMENGLFS